MFITFLILKLTFGAILNECNRLIVQEETKERGRWIKSRLIKLRTDFENGIIDDKTYALREEEILKDLRNGGVSV